ncbi:SEFIR domain-containing protein [Amycolatopsis sp. cmx-4-68]|uniref:SEFIR domain-containing protein n=1 Tax=Amycolatopsis sp. cmx-4-68 TaxID=2790938 RepID=UPI00397DB4F9
MAEGDKAGPARVFISYAHESDEHAEMVRDLWIFLRRCGVDAKVDLPAAQRRQDWALWMGRQVREADHVLVVASAAYRERAEARSGPDVGRGVQWEARLIRNAFYTDQQRVDRFLPVVLPGQSVAGVPDFLAPPSCTVFHVREFSQSGMETLLRVLLDQPAEIEPALGRPLAFGRRDHTLSSEGPGTEHGRDTGRDQPGRPLREVTDPFDYEVHHTIDASVRDLPPLPPYIRRDHDRLLDVAVSRAADGLNQIAVLVGGSSTGKTRACWEALQRLRADGAEWRLWHPIAPTPAEAALAGLARIGPRTVVWLNDAGNYLADAALGERVAATLRELLREARRGPVLVLVTMWTTDWEVLTGRAEGGGADRHAHARALLAQHRIKVPDTFTSRDREALMAAAADPRLDEAAACARDGRITQYLAGGPLLVDRFQDAPAASRALVSAAMDARRLGCGPYLPRALLAQAVPGYLTEPEAEEVLATDWWEAATEYACTRLSGISGMLNRVGAAFRLADYLDELGRRRFADDIPPESFWTAAAHADPGDVVVLADAARARGLLRDAVRLYVHATVRDGCTADRSRRYSGCAAVNAVRLMDTLCPDDTRPRHWAATHCSLSDADDVVELLSSSDPATVTALLARDPASQVALDHPRPVARLLACLHELGAQHQIDRLLARDPAAHVDAADRYGVVDLLGTLRRLGAAGQVDTLARRAADKVAFGYLHRNSVLATLTEVGAHDHAATLATRAAAEVSFAAADASQTVSRVLFELRALGAGDAIRTLLARSPAEHVRDGEGGLASLAEALRQVGADEQIAVLNARMTAMADTGDPAALARVLSLLRAAGAGDRIRELLDRIPAARVDLRHPLGLADLLTTLQTCDATGYVSALLARNPAAHTAVESAELLLRPLRRWGAEQQYETLTQRIALEFPLQDPARLRRLFAFLRYVESPDTGVVASNPIPGLDLLLTRDLPGQLDLADTYEVAGLIADLRDIGATDASTRLAARAVTDASLDDPSGIALLLENLPPGDLVARLLARDPGIHVRISHHENHQRTDVLFLASELRAAGAAAEADHLLTRLVAAGCFDDFRDHVGDFHWGRAPEGAPARPWNWDDAIRNAVGPARFGNGSQAGSC